MGLSVTEGGWSRHERCKRSLHVFGFRFERRLDLTIWVGSCGGYKKVRWKASTTLPSHPPYSSLPSHLCHLTTRHNIASSTLLPQHQSTSPPALSHLALTLLLPHPANVTNPCQNGQKGIRWERNLPHNLELDLCFL